MTISADTIAPEELSDSALNFKTEPGANFALALFVRRVAGRRQPHVARDRVPALGYSIEMLGEYQSLVEMSDGPDEGEKAWLLRHDGDLSTLVLLKDGWAHVWTAGNDADVAWRTCRAVAEQVRADENDIDNTPITFWALNPNRWPQSMRRTVGTPSWESMVGNYAEETVSQMARLMQLDHCPQARMVLWHGPAGTGKTHALRALARHWASWCDVAFITDPEEFVGGSPTYLFSVVNDEAGHPAVEAAKRSTLIVLEDAGELMAADARATSGQGLSRLLNLTDGMLGQGLNVMVLITTNEPISSLHPAVVRPGRCFAEIEFGALSPELANQWLKENGSDLTVDGPRTLASLYHLIVGDDAE